LAFVADPTASKSRLHLDLQPRDHTRDEEFERVIGLGATLLHDRRTIAAARTAVAGSHSPIQKATNSASTPALPNAPADPTPTNVAADGTPIHPGECVAYAGSNHVVDWVIRLRRGSG
jgi:hypothetical protein